MVQQNVRVSVNWLLKAPVCKLSCCSSVQFVAMLQHTGIRGGKWLKVCPEVRVRGETGFHIRKSWKITVMPTISTLPVLSTFLLEWANSMTYAICSHHCFLSICPWFLGQLFLLCFHFSPPLTFSHISIFLAGLQTLPVQEGCTVCATVSVEKYLSFCPGRW